MRKEYQFSTAIPLSELKEKAERLEKLSAQRAALAKRVGIEGKVQAHTSLETAQRVGRVRSKVELSSEIFAVRANDLRHELRAYEQAPAVMAEWQHRAEAFIALSAEHYRGNVKKTDFVKAYKDYKEYADSIERHLPTMRGIERRRQEEREQQESKQLSPQIIIAQCAGARSVVMTDRVIGYPHEEGIDYQGSTCPACPFWAGCDRWTGEHLDQHHWRE